MILDLGYDVKILPNKSWEIMGKPKLVYSPIQLWWANQYCLFPIGRLNNMEVYLVGVQAVANFEVI